MQSNGGRLVAVKCRLCGHGNRHGSDNSHSRPRKVTYFCAACINFKVLKVKLNITNLEYFNSICAAEIQEVLDDCINGHSADFLGRYLAGALYKEEMAGPRELEQLAPSLDARARLAYMLLNVELSQFSKNLVLIKSLLNSQKQTNALLEARIKEKQEELKLRRQQVVEKTQKLLQQGEKEINEISATLQNIKEDKLVNTRKLIDQSQLNNFKQFVALSNFKVVGEMTSTATPESAAYGSLVSKKKYHDHSFDKLNQSLITNLRNKQQTGSIGFTVSIFFTPVLPLTKFIYFSANSVNTSLEKVASFVRLSASYLDVELPYPILKSVDENERESFPEQYSNIDPFMPVITDTLFKENYPLHINRSNEKTENVECLVELTNSQLNSFTLGLSRLLLDILVLLLRVKKDLKPSTVNFGDLLRLDLLLQLLVGDCLPNKNKREDEADSKGAANSEESKPDKQPARKPSISSVVFNFWGRRRTIKSQDLVEAVEAKEPVEKLEQDNSRDGSDFDAALQSESQLLQSFIQEERIDIQNKLLNSNLVLNSSSVTSSTVGVSPVRTAAPIIADWVSFPPSLPNTTWLASKLYDYFVSEITKCLDFDSMSNTVTTIGQSVSSNSTSTYQQIAGAGPGAGPGAESPSLRFKTAPSSSMNTVSIYQANGTTMSHKHSASQEPRHLQSPLQQRASRFHPSGHATTLQSPSPTSPSTPRKARVLPKPSSKRKMKSNIDNWEVI